MNPENHPMHPNQETNEPQGEVLNLPYQPTAGQQTLSLGVEVHHGPLPRASEFQAYENVLPGSADRILKMAELEQKANIKLKRADWFSQFVSMLTGKLFLYFLVICAVYLFIRGKDGAAFLTGLTPALSVLYNTFFGDKKEQTPTPKQTKSKKQKGTKKKKQKKKSYNIFTMSKKLFKRLIKKASTPVPKEADKQRHPDSYSGKRTRQRKAEGTSAKPRGKSRQ